MAADPTRMVQLTDDELVVLDGRCRPEVQGEVEAARARIEARGRLADLPPALAGLVADAVAEARGHGRLALRWEGVTYCRLCKAEAPWSLYKSGPRRGRRKAQGVLQAVDLADRPVVIRGHVSLGGCRACYDAVLPALRRELVGVPAQLPDALVEPGAPRWIRHERVRCTACGWEGHDGQMRRLRALIEGDYAGGCPNCPAENLPLRRTVIERVEGFEVVPRG